MCSYMSCVEGHASGIIVRDLLVKLGLLSNMRLALNVQDFIGLLTPIFIDIL